MKFDEDLSKKACVLKSCKPAHERLKEICDKFDFLDYDYLHPQLIHLEKILHKGLLYRKMDVKIGASIKLRYPTIPYGEIGHEVSWKRGRTIVNCSVGAIRDLIRLYQKYK